MFKNKLRRSLGFLLLVTLALSALPVCAGAPDSLLERVSERRLAGTARGLWVAVVPIDLIDAGPFAQPGQTIEYWAWYENASTDALTNVRLEITLPENCTYSTSYSDPNLGTPIIAGGGLVVFTIGNLDPGQSGFVRVCAQIDETTPGAELICRASVYAGSEWQGGDTSVPTILQSPRLLMTLDTPENWMYLWQTATYTLIYTNTGNLGARNLELCVELPPSFHLMQVVNRPTPSMDGDTMVWQDSVTLAVGETRSIVFAAQEWPTWPADYPLPGDVVTCSSTARAPLLSGVVITSTASNVMEILQSQPPAPAIPTHFAYLANTFQNRSIASQGPWTASYADRWELDDTPRQAIAKGCFMTTDGTITHHSFHKPFDDDWTLFYGTEGSTYIVETKHLADVDAPSTGIPVDTWTPRIDTMLYVYEPGLDPITDQVTGHVAAFNDNSPDDFGALRSTCRFTAATNGWYMVLVQQSDRTLWGRDVRGMNASYDLSIRLLDSGSE